MEQNEEIEMQLWEYLDGIYTDGDKQRISNLIANDAVWLEKFDALSAVHASITTGLELEQPSLRFSKNVMDAVSHVHIAPATKQYINPTIIRSIAAFFIISIAGTFGYALTLVKWTSNATVTVLPYLAKINFSSVFNNDFFSIVMVVNILLGLLFIDTLLRRRREHHTS